MEPTRKAATDAAMKKTEIPELDRIPAYRSWIEVVKTYTKCQRLLTARLAELDLSIPRYELLLAVTRDEGLSQKDLADRLLSAKSNVTGLVQRMEAGGLIRRQPDPDDARGQRVYLTTAGRRLARRGVRVQADVVELMMEGVAAHEAEAVLAAMRQVGARLDAALSSA